MPRKTLRAALGGWILLAAACAGPAGEPSPLRSPRGRVGRGDAGPRALRQDPSTPPRATSGHGQIGESKVLPPLLEQSNDPNAPLVQFQVNEIYAPENINAQGYSNVLELEPVIPIPATSFLPVRQVVRPTVPVVTTPDPGRTSGLGDISLLQVFVPTTNAWGSWGIGTSWVFPTGSGALGSGTWQVGPALTFLYNAIPGWQTGCILQNPISFAESQGRDRVNELLIQPILQHNFESGWYVGMGDLTWIVDWQEGSGVTIPLALQAGRVLELAGRHWNVALEPFYTAIHDGDDPYPRWGVKLGVTLLIPE